MTLQGKKILLGVCGSIAAYKSIILLRQLTKLGAEVQVIMTPSATEFVAPLSFSTLSKRPVYTNIMDQDSWNNHVELGLWADLMMIAPVTASSLSKLASGMADNIVTACYLSARCPVFLAPAMDLDMWQHPSTQNNIDILQKYGNHIILPTHGELASGLFGTGRLAEPEDIVRQIGDFFLNADSLSDHYVLINAGPTIEYIDPVRYLSNPSSGKMGIALAEQAILRGAKVHLILGPTNQDIPRGLFKCTRVESAQEMFDATTNAFPDSTICILAAAVSDYKPERKSTEKIKKTGQDMMLRLVRTQDIAAHLGTQKMPHQVLIGFALETQDEQKNAYKKLQKKNLDFIVLNSLRDPGAGFRQNTNKITIIDRNNKIQDFKLKSKNKVAADILDAVQKLFV